MRVINKIGRPRRDSDLLIKVMITGRIGRQKVLLAVNNKYYTFRGSQEGQKAVEIERSNLFKILAFENFVSLLW